MMCEGPALQSAIGRLPGSSLHLAAWGLTMSLSLLVESPVIMLLATSISLVRDRDSYAALSRFTLRLCLTQTGLTALVAFTPLFRFITVQIMGQPEDIVAAAQPAMQIMVLWTASIAWRRFCQGILVRHGHTRLVSAGTAVRLVSVSTMAVILVLLHALVGVQVAAVSIMCGVIAEALASTWFVRPVRAEVLRIEPSEGTPLTQKSIWQFHLPLALTTLMTLLANPLTCAALARLPFPDLTLAAWPVAFTTTFVIRSGAFAIQEITVSQARFAEARRPLQVFTWLIGAASTALALVVAATPLLTLYLHRAVDLSPVLWPLVKTGMLLCALLPLLTALSGWIRGLLMVGQQTAQVYRAMAVSLAVHATALMAGVLLAWPPITLAAGALTLSSASEVAYLWRQASIRNLFAA